MESVPLKQTQVQIRVNEFIRSVYNWMAIGLGLTGLVAFYVANSPQLVQLIFGNQLLFFGLIIAELALVLSSAPGFKNCRHPLPQRFLFCIQP